MTSHSDFVLAKCWCLMTLSNESHKLLCEYLSTNEISAHATDYGAYFMRDEDALEAGKYITAKTKKRCS